jgi:cytochrome o ubiquinol oxidase subunit II
MSSHYSGDGFSDMNFEVHAVSPAEFSDWVKTTSKATATLDASGYTELAKQSLKVAPATYRLDDANLFQSIATQMLPAGPGPQDQLSIRSIPPSGGADVR